MEGKPHREELELQLSEIEMLSSMYPGAGEITMDGETLVENVQRYVDGPREVLPKQLAYTIKLNIETQQCDVEVHCNYPSEYPKVLPHVFARCQRMSRQSQKEFNDQLQKYMTELDAGELCMSCVIVWIQENASQYVDEAHDTKQNNCTKAKFKCTGFSRLWIYSHHIYRKELLKKIPESAKELNLSGFCLPGKPGIICVEGFKEHCDEYWQRLKYPNWKHISCKHREDNSLKESQSIEEQLSAFRLFEDFEVLAFEAHGDYGLRNDYHMDLGQFRNYLDEHGCQYMFQIFFGLDSKTSTAQDSS